MSENIVSILNTITAILALLFFTIIILNGFFPSKKKTKIKMIVELLFVCSVIVINIPSLINGKIFDSIFVIAFITFLIIDIRSYLKESKKVKEEERKEVKNNV